MALDRYELSEQLRLCGWVCIRYQHETFSSKIFKRHTSNCYYTILGAISAIGVVNVKIRLPNLKPKKIKVNGSRKRKQLQPKKLASKGTVTGHYMLFLQKIMSFTNQYPKMKGLYIVMDNNPIHTADDIDEMALKRGYRTIYLFPSYSPELNPIE